ncbi:MAG: hypothetical protein AN490_03640 [Anabaena sp. AL09]|jgi:hypothetical protein|nr:MAG: hypothetical protein AN482_13575 [Anabaena sp. LE011-02]OBQ12984.1 MAG: hypothetical protein AN490_03640 [Anabaena sp. AL09]
MLPMLPVFYQTYLETQFSPSEYLFLKIIITVLLHLRHVRDKLDLDYAVMNGVKARGEGIA